MTLFLSIEYFSYFVPLAAGLLVIRKVGNDLAQRGILVGINLIFLFLLYRETPALFATHAGIVTLAFFLLRAILASTREKRAMTLAFCGVLALFLTVLGICKYSLFWDSPLFGPLNALILGKNKFSPLPIIGISYTFFKLAHLATEVRNGSVKSLPALDYFNFMLFFPTILSGPIDRFGRFQSDFPLNARVAEGDELSFERNAFRFLLGLFKKVVLVSLCADWALPSLFSGSNGLDGVSKSELIRGIYFYTFMLYFDFSGYSDLAVSTGRMLGVRVPENFRSPLASTTIQEWWNRWHISLSEWIRDYLYYPILTRLYQRFGADSTIVLPGLAFATAFFLCGVWHGDGSNFMIWGALNGLGLGFYVLYKEIAKKKLKKKYKQLKENLAYRAASWALTVNFVVFTNIFFSLKTEQVKLLARRFGI